MSCRHGTARGILGTSYASRWSLVQTPQCFLLDMCRACMIGAQERTVVVVACLCATDGHWVLCDVQWCEWQWGMDGLPLPLM